jgi:ABC-type nitrate/sulfonate/bicarbonate transport system substrate-binding protein
MPAALKSRAIDAFTASLPWTIDAVQSGAAVMVASSPRGDLPEMLPFNYAVLMTRPSLCSDQRPICEKMGHGIAQAMQFVREQPDETLAIVKTRFPQMSDQILAASLATIRNATPETPTPMLDGFENSENFNVNAHVLKPEERLKSFDGLYTDEFVH